MILLGIIVIAALVLAFGLAKAAAIDTPSPDGVSDENLD